MQRVLQATHFGPFPGFDGIRLVAAALVLFSHAFLIAEGSERREPLSFLLGSGNILGLYSVFTFFIVSGFLLTRSLSNQDSIVQFSVNRFLRIVPGFLFCIVATSLVLGPLVTRLDLGSYYARPETYDYISSSLTCLCDNGVNLFGADSKVAGITNGSLWTLSYEVLSYLFLLWLWVILRSTSLVAGAVGAVALGTVLSPFINKVMPGIAYTLPYFSSGVIMYVVYQYFGTNRTLAWGSLGLLCAGAAVGLQHYAFAIFGAYLIVFIAERPNPASLFARRWGDLSYGLYLFGWPVEQLTMQLVRTDSGWQLFAYSLPLALACAAISWWAVERPCLQIKKLVRRLLTQPGSGALIQTRERIGRTLF